MLNFNNFLFYLFLKTEAQREKVLRTFPVDKIYVVTQLYIPNERLCQLGQNTYDIVGVIRTCDPSKNKEIWFVNNGGKMHTVSHACQTTYILIKTHQICSLKKLKDSYRDQLLLHMVN